MTLAATMFASCRLRQRGVLLPDRECLLSIGVYHEP